MLRTEPVTARKVTSLMALLIVLSIGAFAQSDSASHPAPAGSATDKPAAGKAHSDNSYVIGSNAALAIDVWKEPNVSRSVSEHRLPARRWRQSHRNYPSVLSRRRA